MTGSPDGLGKMVLLFGEWLVKGLMTVWGRGRGRLEDGFKMVGGWTEDGFKMVGGRLKIGYDFCE